MLYNRDTTTHEENTVICSSRNHAPYMLSSGEITRIWGIFSNEGFGLKYQSPRFVCRLKFITGARERAPWFLFVYQSRFIPTASV